MTRYASRHPSRGHSLKAQAAAQRERWMHEFQRALVALVPAAAGRIDWQTAQYLFSVGRPAREAAESMADEARSAAAARADGTAPYSWGDKARADQAARTERAAEAGYLSSMND